MCIDLINLDKLHCREIYNILVYTSPHKPTSQVYFENLFDEQELNWKKIYILPRKVSLDCNVRPFKFAFFLMLILQTSQWNNTSPFIWMQHYGGIME